MRSEIARAGEGKGETRMQSVSVESQALEQVATELRDTQARLSETLPKLVSAREQLQRAKVRAPATGQVVGLTVFTVGGVVAPGQTLMDVVPDRKTLVVQAQVSPGDADDVYPGQETQMRFISVQSRNLPFLHGRVRTISADSFTDEKTGRSYFRAEVEVPPDQLAKVRDALSESGLEIAEAELTFVPNNTVEVTDEATAGRIMRMMDALEACDDVTNTHVNFDIPEELLS